MVIPNLAKVLSTMWDGKVTIYEKSTWKDPITKTTQFIESELVTDEPCRVSYASKNAANKTETVTTAPQDIVLFIRPDLDIKEGSKAVVTQNERTVTYATSGSPRVYTAHQEITLAKWSDKA